jgi:hypothetical protein
MVSLRRTEIMESLTPFEKYALSVLDFLTKIIVDRPEYKSWKDGLFKGTGFGYFFDAMER